MNNFIPPKITLCVGTVVLREEKALFVRQTYGGMKGQWSIPWGFVDGRTPDGVLEPPDRAALRETLEEAGVVAEIEGLLGLQNHSTVEGDLRVFLIYLCRHLDGIPTPDNIETDMATYLSLDEMDQLQEPILKFCDWIVRRTLMGNYHLTPPNTQNPYQPQLAFF